MFNRSSKLLLVFVSNCLSILTVVSACSVLDAAEIPFHPDTDRVVSVGQLQPGGSVVVEAQDLTGDASEKLQATI